MWRTHQDRGGLPGTAGGERRQQATPHEARGDRQPDRGETNPNTDPQQQPHQTASDPTTDTPQQRSQQQPHQTAPDSPARPQTQSGRDRKPAEAQAAQSSPDTAAGPQTESTQQEEAEASRVKQQPTRERLTGETGGAHSPATGTAQQKADADKPAAKPQKGGDPPSNQTKPGGDGRATQAFSFYSSAAKAAFRPAVPPGQWQQPAVPKRPPPQPPSDSETSWPSEDPQTTTRWSRHTPPDHAERGDAADAQDAGSRGEERSSQAEPAQADRGAGGGQHDKHAGKGPGQHGAVDRAVGGREQHGHPSPATRRGTQGGQGRTLKKARHQMAELMRSHTEETLAALDQAYGEASSDQYERDRRAEGQERVVGTKAATRAAAAAEHRQEAMQLARSIELHGVEAHLSAAATSLATDGEMGRRGRQGPPPPNAFQIATSELNGVIHRPRGSWPR